MKEKRDFKIITLGNSLVGKTSILQKFINKQFNENTLITLGMERFNKEITLKNNEKIMLQLCDTSGEERHKSITRQYYKNADGILS